MISGFLLDLEREKNRPVQPGTHRCFQALQYLKLGHIGVNTQRLDKFKLCGQADTILPLSS